MSCLCCCCCPSSKVVTNQNTGGAASEQAGQQSPAQNSPHTRLGSGGRTSQQERYRSSITYGSSQSNEEQVAPDQQRSKSRSLLERMSLSRKGSNDKEPSRSSNAAAASPRAPIQAKSFSSSHQNAAENSREQPSQKYSQAVHKPGGLSSYHSSNSEVSGQLLSSSAALEMYHPGSNSEPQTFGLLNFDHLNSNLAVLSSSSAPERETMGGGEHPFAANRSSVASTETGSLSPKSIPSAPSSASGKEAQVLAMPSPSSSIDAQAKPSTQGEFRRRLPPLSTSNMTALKLLQEEREANVAPPRANDLAVEQI